jgi:DHA1 family bicyclomycin/chloramphenicol resistance-like MFS transporter
MAGSASALLGTLQFAIGAGAGTLTGALHTNTALPMAGIIALCGIASLIAYHALTTRTVLQPSAADKAA